MTREEKIKAFAMKLDGKTLQEIGDEFGVSKQCIHQLLNRSCKNRASSICIYKGLSEILCNNNLSIARFCEQLKLDLSPVSISRKLSGKTDFKISEIKKILQVTGLTFEECFAEKETPGVTAPRGI